jgi:alkylation response protein AidB-like acyl-CoA dehydrogenase
MLFQLSEEQLMIQKAARDFAQSELKPGVIERDEHQKFPAEQVKKLGELGFLGMMVSEKYNGSGLDALSYVLVMEELSKIDASASVVVSVNNSLVCYGLESYGSEFQKEKYLKPLASGEKIGAFCLSEPEAGSDATSQQTTAEDKGDYYLLNGTKNWITNGSTASTYLVIAQTDRALKHRGINADCNTLHIGAITYSDAVVLANENIDSNVLKFVKDSNKPTLAYNLTDDFENFYALYEEISDEELVSIA